MFTDLFLSKNTSVPNEVLGYIITILGSLTTAIVSLLKSKRLQRVLIEYYGVQSGFFPAKEHSLESLKKHSFWIELKRLGAMHIPKYARRLKSNNRRIYYKSYLEIILNQIRLSFESLCMDDFKNLSESHFNHMVLSRYDEAMEASFVQIDSLRLSDGREVPKNVQDMLNVWRYEAENDMRRDLQSVLNDNAFDNTKNEQYFKLREVLISMKSSCRDLINQFYISFRDMNGNLDFMDKPVAKEGTSSSF